MLELLFRECFILYNLHDIVFVSPFLYVLAFLQGRILFNSLINNPNVRQEINRAVLYLQYMACMFLGKRYFFVNMFEYTKYAVRVPDGISLLYK